VRRGSWTRKLDGSSITRELSDEEPVKKRKKREIVYRDHDAEMDEEEHKRWKRSLEEPNPYNTDDELGGKLRIPVTFFWSRKFQIALDPDSI
jgi:hypothetical protein